MKEGDIYSSSAHEYYILINELKSQTNGEKLRVKFRQSTAYCHACSLLYCNSCPLFKSLNISQASSLAYLSSLHHHDSSELEHHQVDI